MKKLLVVLSAALLLGISAKAQETFYPGWNFGFQAGATWTRNDQGRVDGKLPVKDAISFPTIGLNLGYEFCPWFGLRGDISGWQVKAIDGKDISKVNYAQFSLDAVFDICNMFKFRSDRGVSPYVFVGPGVNYRFNNPATTHADNRQWAFAPRGGAGLNFRCSDAVKIFVEAVYNCPQNGANGIYDTPVKFLKIGGDREISAFVGLKFTIDQANKKAAALAAAAAAAAEAAAAKAAADKAAAEAAEAARLAAERAAAEKAAAERAAAEKAAAEAAAAKAAAHKAAVDAVNGALNCKDAFPRFVIGKYNLTKDAKKKVEAAADILKVNPDVKVNLVGYADKETGTPAGNWTLSQKRAEAIADALVEKGIDASQLVPAWKGDTEVPFEGAKPAQKRTVTFFAE